VLSSDVFGSIISTVIVVATMTSAVETGTSFFVYNREGPHKRGPGNAGFSADWGNISYYSGSAVVAATEATNITGDSTYSYVARVIDNFVFIDFKVAATTTAAAATDIKLPLPVPRNISGSFSGINDAFGMLAGVIESDTTPIDIVLMQTEDATQKVKISWTALAGTTVIIGGSFAFAV
jgi:hypothetical protein